MVLLRSLVYHFPACTFEWYPDGSPPSGRTVYPDGTTLPAAPQPTPEYRATARRLGYGRRIDRMCLEHELAHHWLAAQAGGRSETLWLVAHGACTDENLAARLEEEAQVMAFQARVNRGQEPEFRRWARLRV